MRKIIPILLLIIVLLVLSTNGANASLLVIESDGRVQLNVLSAETESVLTASKPSNLQINKIVSSVNSDASLVKLGKTDNKISLDIYGSTGSKNLDVTNYKENVLEIEQRPNIQKLTIAIVGDRFSLQDNGTVALTILPLTVDSKTADLTVRTDSGEKKLIIYPFEAVQTALRTRLISNIAANGVEIIDDKDMPQYKITGSKVINILNFYDYAIPVSSYISAVTGEVIKIDAPGWLKIVNVIFT